MKGGKGGEKEGEGREGERRRDRGRGRHHRYTCVMQQARCDVNKQGVMLTSKV